VSDTGVMTGNTDPTQWSTHHDLCVEFEVEPPPESHCPLGGFSEDVETVRQQLVGEECHTDVTLLTEDCDCRPGEECREVVHAASDLEQSCLCAVFAEYDCVPEVVDVDENRLRIEARLPDRDRLADLVGALKEVGESVRLRKLKRIDRAATAPTGDTVTLDLLDVTEKQREAVTTAVAAGYYSRPRETSFDRLADELDISKSALSQRLNAVESKLATAAFAEATATE
jgi:hypothetical protein